jgi:DNA modification methylase/transcriptional regulator with XRE-family HTH domain
MSLITRIKSYRKTLEKTQTDIAAESGLSFSVVVAVEQGKGSWDSLLTIVDTLGIEVSGEGYDGNLGKFIKETREGLGISKNRLSKLSKVDHKTVGNVEMSGNGNLSIILKILSKLKQISKSKNDLLILTKERKSYKVPAEYDGYVPPIIPTSELPSKSIKDLRNSIINGNCQEVLKQLPDGCIDAVLTSPPYSDARAYHHHEDYDLKIVGKELLRVLKDGGVLIWNEGDLVNDDRVKSLKPLESLLLFRDIGFNAHDVIFWNKNAVCYPAKPSDPRYTNIIEYVFILSKGTPKTVNLLVDRPNKTVGRTSLSNTDVKSRDGLRMKSPAAEPMKAFSVRTNVWEYPVGGGATAESKLAHGHPALMNLNLAQDLIRSYSNPGDLILDPFAGASTSAVASITQAKNYMMIEISMNYCQLSQKRLSCLAN